MSDAVTMGATRSTPVTCERMTSMSACLNLGGEVLVPSSMRWPGITMIRLLPRLEIWLDTEAVAPLPNVTVVTTADTPITIPSIVSIERMRLRRISRNASTKVLPHITGLHCSAPRNGCRLSGRH